MSKHNLDHLIIHSALSDLIEDIEALLVDINNNEINSVCRADVHHMAYAMADKASSLADDIKAYRARVAGPRPSGDENDEHRLSAAQLGLENVERFR